MWVELKLGQKALPFKIEDYFQVQHFLTDGRPWELGQNIWKQPYLVLVYTGKRIWCILDQLAMHMDTKSSSSSNKATL